MTAQVIVWETIYPQVFTDAASMRKIGRNKDETSRMFVIFVNITQPVLLSQAS